MRAPLSLADGSRCQVRERHEASVAIVRLRKVAKRCGDDPRINSEIERPRLSKQVVRFVDGLDVLRAELDSLTVVQRVDDGRGRIRLHDRADKLGEVVGDGLQFIKKFGAPSQGTAAFGECCHRCSHHRVKSARS